MARIARVVAPGTRTKSPSGGTGDTAAEMSMVSPEFQTASKDVFYLGEA